MDKRYSNIIWKINQNKIDLDFLKNHLSKNIYISYSKFQIEKDEEENLSFYRGYSELSSRKRITQLSKDFLGAEVGPAFESHKENIDYFSKSEKRIDGPWEIGNPKTLRKKTVDERWIDLRSGEFNSYEEVFNVYPSWSVKNKRQIEDIIAQNNPSAISLVKKKIVWICGGSGSGKSTFALKRLFNEGYTREQICIKKAPSASNPRIFFSPEDKYKKALIIEEIRFGSPEIYDLISIFDGNENLHTKGGTIPNNFQHIVVMSINNPREIYKNLGAEDQIQILRRLSNVVRVLPNKYKLNALKSLDYEDFVQAYEPIVYDLTEQIRDYLLDLNEKMEDTYNIVQNLEIDLAKQTKIIELFKKESSVSFETILSKLEKDSDPIFYEEISNLALKEKLKKNKDEDNEIL